MRAASSAASPGGASAAASVFGSSRSRTAGSALTTTGQPQAMASTVTSPSPSRSPSAAWTNGAIETCRAPIQSGQFGLTERAKKMNLVSDAQGFGLSDAAQTKALGIAHQVHFLGALGSGRTARLYRRAAIFIAPFVQAADGDREGLGLVTVEAIACRSSVSALPALFDLLDPKTDAAALAPPGLYADLAARRRSRRCRAGASKVKGARTEGRGEELRLAKYRVMLRNLARLHRTRP